MWMYITKVEELKNEFKEEETTLRLAVYIAVLMFEAKIWWVYNMMFFWIKLIKSEKNQIQAEFDKVKEKEVKSV
jgi:hypothetical protein